MASQRKIIAGKRSGQRPKGATRKRSKQAAQNFSMPAINLRLPLMILFLLLTLSGLGYLTRQLSAMPVGDVYLSGHAERLSSQVVLDSLSELLDKGFWALDVKGVKDLVEQQAWVRQAVVRRQWPNQLHIGVDTHVPVARWTDQRLLSSDGVLFEASHHSFENLPLFLTQDSEIYQAVDIFNRAQYWLEPFQQKVVELGGSPGRVWWLVTDGGLRIELGHWGEGESADVTSKFGNMVAVFEKLGAEKIQQMHAIDLRYPNGVAVTWRHGNGPLDS